MWAIPALNRTITNETSGSPPISAICMNRKKLCWVYPIEPNVKPKNPKLLMYSIAIQIKGVRTALYFGSALPARFMKRSVITKYPPYTNVTNTTPTTARYAFIQKR
ncbi:hypothetical protein ES703_123633 [subsurface metagenome]